jgi:hypothetical protein
MDAHAVSTYRTVINAPHLNLSMSTSHPPNVYTSSYRHQLAASQSRPLPPPPSYLHQPYPTNDNHPQPPLQVARSSFRDPASSDQPSPNRDGGDPYSNRKKRDTWDARLERKTRPATIAELAEKSCEDLCDPNKHLKHWLRTAELARKSGGQYAENGDYERSFIQFARAASIFLEKMPTHKDYHTLLTSSQRNNLALVSLYFFLPPARFYLPLSFSSFSTARGVHLCFHYLCFSFPQQRIFPACCYSLLALTLLEPCLTLVSSIQHGRETLDNLSRLKPGLHDRYEKWAAKYPEHINDPSFKPPVLLESATFPQSASQSQQPTSATTLTSISQPNSRDSGEGQYVSRSSNRARERERDRERDRSREPPRDYHTQPTHDSPARRNEEARRLAVQAMYSFQPAHNSPAGRNEEARRAAEEAIRQRTDEIRNAGKASADPNSPPPPPPQDTETDEYDTPPVHVTPSDSRGEASQGSNSHGWEYKSSFAPSRQTTQRLAESQTRQAAVHRQEKSGGADGKTKGEVHQDGWAENSSLALVDTAATSASKSGTSSAPPSPSCTEC